ncbi:E3 SUMO-protein ligase KIAA1586-like [Hydra vulgaris]|uniref:E3 SUMO-protein ligase KIAA1586-like n=1 Tax=Hydra vulgaris TaxID=6087 RepID=A0ABM4CAP0_HYDVU
MTMLGRKSGVATKLTEVFPNIIVNDHTYFIEDLALIIDILEEFSILSNALQSRKITILKADQLIKRTIRAIELHKNYNFGIYEKKVQNLISSNEFKCIPFDYNNKFVSLPREQLLDSVAKNMKARLLSASHINMDEDKNENNDTDNYEKLVQFFEILDPSTWSLDKIMSPWLEGEDMVRKLCIILKFKVDVNDFRDFADANIQLKNVQLLNSILRAKKIASTIAISSSEAERGFSLMNLIASKLRTSLTVEHISNLMKNFFWGKLIANFDFIPFVKSWMNQNHRLATETKVRRRHNNDVSVNEQGI